MFTRALGHQAELMMDAGFARIGFRIRQSTAHEVDGRRWTSSEHNLDRVIERDDVRYGVEIKNQLGYIDQTEFEIKLAMCKFFGIRQMFVARMMPKNYIQQVRIAGGFSLLFGNQHYPLMGDKLARRVREQLQLPVLTIRELPDTTRKRFEDWHIGQLKGRGG